MIKVYIHNEQQFNKYHANNSHIAQVMQNQTYNGEIGTQTANPAQMGGEIRRLYGNDFKYVLQSSWNFNHAIAYGNNIFLHPGSYVEPGIAEMLSLKMLRGSRNGLKEMNSILLSGSVAQSIFGQ